MHRLLKNQTGCQLTDNWLCLNVFQPIIVVVFLNTDSTLWQSALTWCIEDTVTSQSAGGDKAEWRPGNQHGLHGAQECHLGAQRTHVPWPDRPADWGKCHLSPQRTHIPWSDRPADWGECRPSLLSHSVSWWIFKSGLNSGKWLS